LGLDPNAFIVKRKISIFLREIEEVGYVPVGSGFLLRYNPGPDARRIERGKGLEQGTDRISSG
jgi:hypothetical protein